MTPLWFTAFESLVCWAEEIIKHGNGAVNGAVNGAMRKCSQAAESPRAKPAVASQSPHARAHIIIASYPRARRVDSCIILTSQKLSF